ncbi:MAG TPA: rhomboid family intramembrane serine protease [Pirellulales bacterium]
MGLYDRDYVRGREPGFFLSGSRTAVTDLIIVNVVVFLLDIFMQGQLADWFALQADVLHQPWRIYELLTYGFVHDGRNLQHIFFNMFGLWLFGRDVEAIYGRNEFLRIYLSLVVLCGAVWVAVQYLVAALGRMPSEAVIGASGAVLGIMVLYVTYYPRRVFLFWGILPMPAWLLCVLFILQDLMGVQAGVAHEVHLAGAAFAFLYRKSGWNLGTLFTGKWTRKLQSLRRPRLQLHEPKPEEPDQPVVSNADQVDRILAKISEQGEASLTRDERRILEDASRRYQQRRR